MTVGLLAGARTCSPCPPCAPSSTPSCAGWAAASCPSRWPAPTSTPDAWWCKPLDAPAPHHVAPVTMHGAARPSRDGPCSGGWGNWKARHARGAAGIGTALTTSANRIHANRQPEDPMAARNIAVIGAGMAGLACARTLVQAGHRVTVFEKIRRRWRPHGQLHSPFGTFDHGAQYFTVRDPALRRCLGRRAGPVPPLERQRGARAGCRTAWWPKRRCRQARGALGRRAGHDALPRHWAQPLAGTQPARVEDPGHPDRTRRSTAASWQLQTAGRRRFAACLWRL
jgi:hypothetical protein